MILTKSVPGTLAMLSATWEEAMSSSTTHYRCLRMFARRARITISGKV